jgi:RimJ/RimL family protein N-acetyltransferase
MQTDVNWLTELANDPEAAKYSLSIFPRTEHEVEESLKKELEDSESKYVVAECDGEPAGHACLWWRNIGRDSHVAWLGIDVRRRFWGKGIGSELMRRIIIVAKDLGFRKIMLGVFQGNERALGLYRKFGFRNEAYEKDEVWIDGSWRKNFTMGLQLMPCKPRFRPTGAPLGRKTASKLKRSILQVRQLNNLDLDEVNRLQNCLESTKSSFRVPPVTREQTKQWYEGITSERHRHCLACFSGDKLRGYLQFRALLLPFPCLKLEEVIVDANEESYRTAAALVEALRSFRERYRYRMISAFVPQTSAQIAGAFEGQGFRKTGSLKNYYFIDGFYVDAIFREYP